MLTRAHPRTHTHTPLINGDPFGGISALCSTKVINVTDALGRNLPKRSCFACWVFTCLDPTIDLFYTETWKLEDAVAGYCTAPWFSDQHDQGYLKGHECL